MLPVRRRPRPDRQVRSNIRPQLDCCEVRLTPAQFFASTPEELIAAINTANVNGQADTITLAEGAIFNFTAAADLTDGGSALPSILFDGGNALKIIGGGATLTRPTSGPEFRFFRVADSLQGPAQLILTDLTLTGGFSGGDGGAIFLTGGTVELINCLVTNNSANNGGAIGTFNSSLKAPEIRLTSTVVTGNTASGNGGALSNLGSTSFIINDSVISNNIAGGSGGALRSLGGSKLTISGSTFENNKATSAVGNGGAVSWQADEVAITGSVFRGNVGGSGGAIAIFKGSTATISDSKFIGNSTTFGLSSGGAIDFTGSSLSLTNTLVDANIAKAGGGLAVNGDLTVINSAIVNNSANGSNGGGVAVTGGALTMTNVTLDKNSAVGSGGGVFMPDGIDSAVLINLTVTQNTANQGGGGLFLAVDGTGAPVAKATLGNTVLAYNAALGGGDLFGVYFSSGGNLFGVYDPDFALVVFDPSDLLGTPEQPLDPILLPLADNGGGTPTRAPGRADDGALSPLIDRGINGLNKLASDQRNESVLFPRIDTTDNKIDIGAFEAPKGDLRIRKTGPTGNLIPGQVVTFSIIAENVSLSPNQNIPNARIQDLLDARFVVQTAIWTAEYVGTDGPASGTGPIDEVVNLPIGASVTYTLSVQVARSATGTLTNVAGVGAPGLVDPTPEDNTAVTSNPLRPTADVRVVKQVNNLSSGGNRVAAGVPIRYTVTVSNFGPSDVNNVRFTDAVPLGATRMTWTATTDLGGDGEIDFTDSGVGGINQLINLPFGTVVTYSIVIDTSFDRDGSLTNQAKAVLPAGVTDPVPENNSSTVVVELSPGGHVVVAGSGPGEVAVVRVYVAQTGTILREIKPYGGFRGGVTTAAADFNGDGVLDIVTAAGVGGGPHVQVFDGATGERISSFFAYDPNFTGGVFVAAGDTDGDGVPEIVTGPGQGGGPHVRILNWQTGESVNQPLTDFFAYDPNFFGGVRVAAGDLNGDRRFDVLTAPGPGGGPHVQSFDGATGQRTASLFAYDPNFAGGVFVTAGDLNFDGNDDIITGPGFGGGAHVRAFSARNGQLFREFIAFNREFPPALLTVGGNAFTSGLRVSTTAIGPDGTALVIVAPGPGARPVVQVIDTSTGRLDLQYAITDGFDPAFLGGVFVGGG